MSKVRKTKRYNLEEDEQTLFFNLIAKHTTNYPDFEWWLHIPNGGDRHVAVAAKLKRMGAKAGVADVLYPVARGRYIGCWLEFKRPANAILAATKPSYKYPTKVKQGSNQDAFLLAMVAKGHFVQVVYTAQEAIKLAVMYEKGKLDKAPLYPEVLEIRD